MRTIMWLLVLAVLLLFSFFNWNEVTVKIWENLVVETKVPALVIVSFLFGLLPMWIYHRGARWSLSRKIISLENAARAHASSKEEAAAAARERDSGLNPPPSQSKPPATSPDQSFADENDADPLGPQDNVR
ncbi:MAG: LapA family protein [Erythrobacter sp.]|nr:LapA family protein [Erythrobacter sp.]